MIHLFSSLVIASILLILSFAAISGEADIVDVKVQHQGGDLFQIITTVKHADTGWDHYANGFEILDLDDNLIGTRVLYHPHVNEQPFTRSLRVAIPAGISKIKVRAVDSVHGTGGRSIVVVLPR